MELIEYIKDHISLSKKVFGDNTFRTGRSHKGLIEHIKKELDEIDQDPTDLYEWIDVIILAIDGAWRAGFTAEDVDLALFRKQTVNFNRIYPEHDKSGKEPVEHIRNS